MALSLAVNPASTGGGRMRALRGQRAMQRMQRIHLAASVLRGSVAGMAPVGHLRTHMPQPPQASVTCGVTGICGSGRYSGLPGTLTVSILVASLAAAAAPNSTHLARSSAWGAAGGYAAGNAVLGDEGSGRNYGAAAGGQHVFELQQCIIVGPVAVDHHGNGRVAAALDFAQAFHRNGWQAASIDREHGQ